MNISDSKSIIWSLNTKLILSTINISLKKICCWINIKYSMLNWKPFLLATLLRLIANFDVNHIETISMVTTQQSQIRFMQERASNA